MDKIKTIAMYLPQYHQLPENDEWWGEGFTEWTAVKAADPLFEGHMQPKRPLNKNYYNLLEKSVMVQQEKLMKEYGIDGMCFYHYYFKNGHKILEKPAENLLTWKDIDMPFCFCWANESWARTWSNIGNKNSWADKFEKAKNDKEILLEQKYGREYEWKMHFEYLLPFFLDDRYIRKDNAPVFLIYKPDEIACLYQMLDYWRKLAKECNIPNLYFIGLNVIHAKKALDAILLNAPALFWNPIKKGKNILPHWIDGIKSYNYEDIWTNILSSDLISGIKTYIGGFVNYDDTPRRNRNGIVIRDFSIEKFQSNIYQLIKKNYLLDNEYIFINAWNEWGEGMYLEPDEIYGYQYLEAVRDAKKAIEEEILNNRMGLPTTNMKKDIRNEKLLHILDRNSLIAGCLDSWMTLKEKGINPAEYLKRYKYNTIAVYGMGILGRHLLYDLEQAGINIAYIIDRRVELKHPRLEIKSVEDVSDDVDAVVVTAIAEFDDIYEVLRRRINSAILSIAELLNEI